MRTVYRCDVHVGDVHPVVYYRLPGERDLRPMVVCESRADLEPTRFVTVDEPVRGMGAA